MYLLQNIIYTYTCTTVAAQSNDLYSLIKWLHSHVSFITNVVSIQQWAGLEDALSSYHTAFKVPLKTDTMTRPSLRLGGLYQSPLVEVPFMSFIFFASYPLQLFPVTVHTVVDGCYKTGTFTVKTTKTQDLFLHLHIVLIGWYYKTYSNSNNATKYRILSHEQLRHRCLWSLL